MYQSSRTYFQETHQASSADADIGELHFLVKQEAKGDLRKDARVQDLNNVINRLMCSNNWESGASSRRRRRLHLRASAVTCLSEDIYILEWVPDTDSLRNLVMKLQSADIRELPEKTREPPS
jgi:phosphatidylinositol kinase/protein kinase (PI-3  family)